MVEMQLASRLSPERAALLVIDMQNDYVHPEGALSRRRGGDAAAASACLSRVNELIGSARNAGVRVCYIRVTHALENTLPNKLEFRQDVDDLWPSEGSWGSAWHEHLKAPTQTDVVVTKHNYDGFADTSLDLTLRSLNVRALVFSGVSTEVCVETTARSAFVRGYEVVVASDATASTARDAHEASLAVLGRSFGKVVATQDIVSAWTVGEK